MPITVSEYKAVVKEIRSYVPRIKIKVGGDEEDSIFDLMDKGIQACYCLTEDTIYTQRPEKYRSVKMFRHIMFHELGHWACQTGRAGKVSKFTPYNAALECMHKNYAAEEIIVDCVSFHFCVMSGHPYNASSHERYINNWAKKGGLKPIWNQNIENYVTNKTNTVISFIHNYRKNLA